MRILTNIIAVGTVLFAFTTIFIFMSGDKNLYNLLSRQKPLNTRMLSGIYDFSKTSGSFNNRPIKVPQYMQDFTDYRVLGATNVAKRIEINLTNQELYAYEGENRIYTFPISSGRWAPTPKGVFKIWIKLRYANMEGGSQLLGTYYFLPNVPYVMYFYNQQVPQTEGYGIHGAYWHNNFGRPMSHGCINMRPEDAKQIYYWAEPDLRGRNSMKADEPKNPGTELIIYGDPVI